MTQLTRAQVLANRQAAVAYLKKPHIRKAKHKLDAGDGRRCCLGHMCYALDVKRQKDGDIITYGANEDDEYAPQELITAVGLWTRYGGAKKLETLHSPLDDKILQPNFNTEDQTPHTSLASVNDELRVSPQRIGKYLESVIEGGEDTPWKPLSEYPE